MIYVEKITISPRTKVLNVGDKYRGASAVVCPSNATCKSIRWYSEDSSIAGVTGTTGYIRAIAPGKVKIYAEATDGSGVRNYIGIVVKQPVTDISLDCSNATINIGESKTVTATVSPSNASNKNISWTSCDESVATVDSDGVVTGRGVGSTTIIASAQDGSGCEEEFTIKVCDPSVEGTPVTVKCVDGLSIMSKSSGGGELGTFNNGSIIYLINSTPQNETMFYVFGTMSDGRQACGWCSGEYLEKEVIFKEWNGSGNINVRLEASTSTNNIIGRLPPSGKVLLLQENYTTNSHTWHKILYANRDAYISDQSGLSTKTYWLPLVRRKAGDTLTNQDINRIVANVQNCSGISSSKRAAAASFAKILLENSYEPTFVAGILANFEKEGNIGQLENSNYTTYPNKKPDYLVYMDSQYNGPNYYLNNYSNKTIMDLGVNAVYNILLDLKTRSNDTWDINGSRVGFGIGSFQWTFDRSWKLMIRYRDQNNGADTISNGQVINAEMSMLIGELVSNEYYDVLPFWEDQCTSHFDTVGAANRAGFTVCTHYLKPEDTNQPQIRATLAEQIYTDMMA